MHTEISDNARRDGRPRIPKFRREALRAFLEANRHLTIEEVAAAVHMRRATVQDYRKEWGLSRIPSGKWTREQLEKYIIDNPEMTCLQIAEKSGWYRVTVGQIKRRLHVDQPAPDQDREEKLTYRRCLMCDKWDWFADNLHIHENCKASRSWVESGLCVHGFARARKSLGGAV